MRMSLRKEIEDYKRDIMAQNFQHISIEGEKITILPSTLDDKPKIYFPSKTGSQFHSDNSIVRMIKGPYGSGKSTMCIMEIIKRSTEMPFWSSGRRKSKWAVIRNTSGELYSTTFQTWMDWLGSLGDIKVRQKPILTISHSFNDGKGIVELTVLFIALDKPQDVRKIKSLEVTGAYINEASEVPEEVIKNFQGRINRYPSTEFCKEDYFSGIIADTNPPDEDHWIPKNFDDPSMYVDGYKLYKQPPGLIRNSDGLWVNNKEADNITHLRSDYYPTLAKGQTQNFIDVFCLGKYGSVGTGKLVFMEFNSDLHSHDALECLQGEPLYLGWDFGLTPACVVVQLSPRGRLLVLKEYVGTDIGLRSFAESFVIPAIKRDFPYCKIGDSYADPSGTSREDVLGELTCISELCSLGVETVPASTNNIEPRLAAVRYFLNRMADGKPSFAIDRRNCPTIWKGFVKHYVYKRLAVSGEARYRDVPDKNMSSHPMDALQYVCLALSSDTISDKKAVKTQVNMFNPVMNF